MDVDKLASPDDPRAAPFRRLNDAAYRRQLEKNGPFGGGIFVIEGWNSLEVATRSRFRIATVLVAEPRLERLADLLDGARGVNPSVLVAPQKVVDDICGFPLHRGVVAAAERGRALLADTVIKRSRAILAIEGVNDAENMGALFRNAAALGVDGVLMGPTVCDPLSRRAVRVSLGHVLRTDFARSPFPDVIGRLTEAGFRTFALTPARHAVNVSDVELDGDRRVAIVVGAEGSGLDDATTQRCTDAIRIPMASGVDSLNVATAAAIALNRLCTPDVGR